jgi:hypothetical protein
MLSVFRSSLVVEWVNGKAKRSIACKMVNAFDAFRSVASVCARMETHKSARIRLRIG